MTHPFTTDEVDYRRLCEAARLVIAAWGDFRPWRYNNSLELWGAMLELRRALSSSDALPPADEALFLGRHVPITTPPGRRVLIDGKECTLVELEDGR